VAAWWLLTDIQGLTFFHPCHATEITRNTGGLTHPLLPKSLPYPNLPVGALSILWQFWDPTWKALQRSHLQGHEARVEGKVVWLVSSTWTPKLPRVNLCYFKRCQGLVWVFRAILMLALRFQASLISRGVFWFALFFEVVVCISSLPKYQWSDTCSIAQFSCISKYSYYSATTN
jgi:hypothetical protein